jgi:hypothetical protein
MHKYMKIGKRKSKKEKEKGFPANWARGIFGPAERVREGVVKLKSYINLIRTQQRGKSGAHWSGGRARRRGSIELGGGEREWPRPV